MFFGSNDVIGNDSTFNISARGNLSLGTNTPQTERLWVNGTTKSNNLTLTSLSVGSTNDSILVTNATVKKIPGSSYQPAGTYVTSVTGTSPILSSGGTTPAISADTTKIVLFNDTIGTGSTGKIETKYHAVTTFEPIISPDGSSKWWRSDKTWQPLTVIFDSTYVKSGTGIRVDSTGNTYTINNITWDSTYLRTSGSYIGLDSVGNTYTISVSGLQPTITPQNVTAGSTKISLGGTPTGAALQAFSIDVAEANVNHNNLLNYISQKHFYQKDIDTVKSENAGLLKADGNGVLTGITDNSTAWNLAQDSTC